MSTRIEAFISQAHRVQHDETAKKALCEAELVWLYGQGRTDLTVAKKDIPPYKEALRQAGLVRGKYIKDFNETWLLYLSADKAKMAEYNDAYTVKRNSRVDGHQYIIRNPHTIVETAIALLDSWVSYNLVAGLCVLTGRRESEIGVTARFLPLDDAPMWVAFIGQLKGDEEKRHEKIAIPVLGNREKVLAGLERLRTIVSWHTRYTPKQFDASVAPDVRKRCKDVFTPLFPGCELPMSAHAMRKVYAALANAWCPHVGTSDHRFVANIMGHDIRDETSATAYEYFTVEEPSHE